MPVAPKFAEILAVLVRHEVEFILVGGLAAVVHGSPLMTEDVDIVYRSSEQNLSRLASALKEMKAHYLDPAGRHIEPDVPRLATMRMNLLSTSLGRLDALRSVGPGLTYSDLFEKSKEMEIEGLLVRVLDLEVIIETKEYAGRAKDKLGLLYLRQLLDEREQFVQPADQTDD